MIRNRFSVLLAERELTASKVSADTGISRSTLSTLVNNSGDGVQFKTLDKICNYLEISPNDFFDYSPYILEYSLQLTSDRMQAFKNKESLISMANSGAIEDDKSKYYEFSKLDILGEARHIIEIIATTGQKKYKYQLTADVFEVNDVERTNASSNFDIVCILEDDYVGKSFTNEIFNQVSVSFQTQIRNDLFDLIKDSLKNFTAFATVRNQDINIYIETPFGDTNFVKSPDPSSLEKYREEYGSYLLNSWK